jgi:hypothetical protein
MNQPSGKMNGSKPYFLLKIIFERAGKAGILHG